MQKSVERYSQAIGLVINMTIDPTMHSRSKGSDHELRSYLFTPIDEASKPLPTGNDRHALTDGLAPHSPFYYRWVMP